MRPRRRFLLLTIGAALLGRIRRVIAAPMGLAPTPAPEPRLDALPAYLDTLLPRDQSPAATDLGVDKKLIALVKRSPRGLKILVEGCGWLDEQARATGATDFAALAEPQRASVVARAADAERGTMPRRFFEQSRDAAFTLYYAEPGSWPALGYEGPPQPRGFPGFELPPHGAGS